MVLATTIVRVFRPFDPVLLAVEGFPLDEARLALDADSFIAPTTAICSSDGVVAA
jgi:hypothetical protein